MLIISLSKSGFHTSQQVLDDSKKKWFQNNNAKYQGEGNLQLVLVTKTFPELFYTQAHILTGSTDENFTNSGNLN
jgi:hypothetical protein